MSHPLQVGTNGFISLAEPQRWVLSTWGRCQSVLVWLQPSWEIWTPPMWLVTSISARIKAPDVLQRAAEHISQAFPSNDRIEPTHAIIITWENVAPQSERGRADDYTVCPSILNILHLQKLVMKQAQQHLQVKSPLFKFLLQYARICKVIVFQYARICKVIVFQYAIICIFNCNMQEYAELFCNM